MTQFFDLGPQPFANGLVKNKETRGKTYPLSLSRCCECCLVQLNQTADPEELFSNYVWTTGTSSTARDYSVKFCETVLEHKTVSKDSGYILEIASNDGTFLEPFISKGYKVLGIDPAKNVAGKAVLEGIPTKCGFFGESLAEEIVSKQGKPEVVFARNVLPHVADLHDFVKGIETCTSQTSLIVIEVHYAKVILEELHYDSIYHEHLCYFSLKSIENLLNSFGLYVYDIMPSQISGGSIVLFVKKEVQEAGDSLKLYRDNESRDGTNEISSWKKFSEDAFSHRKSLLGLLDEECKQGRTVVGYGASARSSTLLNFCGINSKYIIAIADQNPLKHGLFTAGTHIPIFSPEEVMKSNPDTIFLMAWNFQDEIIGILQKRFGFRGTLIVPLPDSPKTMNMGTA